MREYRNAVIATLSSSLLAGTPSAAVSPEAQYLSERLQKPWESFQRSAALGYGDLLSDLAQLAGECNQPNWDGYGAAPMSPQAIAQAERFLRALPLGEARPTVGVEPDGQVTFEWYASPRRTLSVSISPEGDVHYAALFGPARQYGTEPFLGEVPTAILELIRRVGRP